jgi:hypothetical protein
MSNHTHDTDARDDYGFETRAAIDVMFEALSHIQASIDASTEKERVESYRKFKEALYARYEHLLEKRRGEHVEVTLEKQTNGNGRAEDRPAKEDAEDSDAGSDTLGKLWPTISDKGKTLDL